MNDQILAGPDAHDLRALHEVYVDAVNRAVADDRDDLVADLATAYPQEMTSLIMRGASRACLQSEGISE